MTSDTSERARESRKSWAVLKLELITIRARDRVTPILVFEGDDDIGPYSVWVSRVRNDWNFLPLPGKGKEQVLDLRVRLKADTTEVGIGVYFLIDRDFDDLRGHPAGEDLFCTGSYSIENYLVSNSVLMAIFYDEFRCANRHEVRQQALGLFNSVMNQFLRHMHEANRRIYRARTLNIRVKGALPKRIQEFVIISPTSVSLRASLDLTKIIALEREPTADECVEIDKAFDNLDPQTRHRGKYLLAFFLRWLDEISKVCSEPSKTPFKEHFNHGFSFNQLTLRSLATRSEIPPGFDEFVRRLPKFCGNSVH